MIDSSRTKNSARCALCSVEDKICREPEGKGPGFCPTLNEQDLIEEVLAEYAKPEVRHFALQASIQEGEAYGGRDQRPYTLHPIKPRVQEIWEFAERMKYRKLGLAFCAGLHPEAKIAADIFKARGFEVVSVVCKAGGAAKETLGIEEEQKIRIGEFESMCNPIMQANVLNKAGTDFNVLIGLCVGHDSLFFKYAEAPTTVLIVKDRLLGHNPAAALYTGNTYYARLKQSGKGGR